MKRHSFWSISTGVRAAAFVASTLTVVALALAPAVYAQNADDTVALERPLPAFEENFPTDEAQPQAVAAARQLERGTDPPGGARRRSRRRAADARAVRSARNAVTPEAAAIPATDSLHRYQVTRITR